MTEGMEALRADIAAPADAGDEAIALSALPLLLLPGTLCDARMFAPLVAALGHPDTIVADMTLAGRVGDLARAILATAPPRFALLGFSLGGIVALEMAALAPERIAGLALIATNPGDVPQADRAGRRAVAAGIDPASLRRVIEERLWPLYVAGEHRGDGALRALIGDMAEALGPDVWRRQIELAVTRADSRPRLPAIACPVLLLCGAEDSICPPDMHRLMAEALPDAVLEIVPDAGHFLPLEAPDVTARAVAAWLRRTNLSTFHPASAGDSHGGNMTDDTGKPAKAATKAPATPQETGAVLQVERRDFTQLVPENRERVQSMRGFDDCYTDIVDYIIRCTHKIWDERDIGLIYTHYTHNCVVYGVLGTMYERETIVRETIQRAVELPDRRGMAIQVIWRGNDVDGFYTSHMTHGTGRHTEYGAWGKPTGRTFVTRTVADCMILENKIYKEWVVRDNMGLFIQLGIDPHEQADKVARQKFELGERVLDLSENRRLLGQYPPESEADVSLAHDEGEAQLLRDLHHIYNKRMFGRIHDIYAPTVQWHGPLMRELYGIASVLQQTMRLVALMPDASFVVQHICSNASEEGGTKYAVRWVMDGHHFGYGSLGAPTGHHLFVLGVTHFHIIDGKIVDEWVLYDEFSMLVQIKLAELQKAAA